MLTSLRIIKESKEYQDVRVIVPQSRLQAHPSHLDVIRSGELVTDSSGEFEDDCQEKVAQAICGMERLARFRWEDSTPPTNAVLAALRDSCAELRVVEVWYRDVGPFNGSPVCLSLTNTRYTSDKCKSYGNLRI
jgi:hypothetical protein